MGHTIRFTKPYGLDAKKYDSLLQNRYFSYIIKTPFSRHKIKFPNSGVGRNGSGTGFISRMLPGFCVYKRNVQFLLTRDYSLGFCFKIRNFYDVQESEDYRAHPILPYPVVLPDSEAFRLR